MGAALKFPKHYQSFKEVIRKPEGGGGVGNLNIAEPWARLFWAQFISQRIFSRFIIDAITVIIIAHL